MVFDQFGRKIDYLRISVTDRCNLRCIYCMPESGIRSLPPNEVMTFEEILRVAKIASKIVIYPDFVMTQTKSRTKCARKYRQGWLFDLEFGLEVFSK